MGTEAKRDSGWTLDLDVGASSRRGDAVEGVAPKQGTEKMARETLCELRPSNGTASLPHWGGSQNNQTLTSFLSPPGLPPARPNQGQRAGGAPDQVHSEVHAGWFLGL